MPVLIYIKSSPKYLLPRTPISEQHNGRFRVALEKERKFPRPSLLRACGDTFGREFLTLGWLKAANTGIGFSGPLLLKVVVNAVQDSSSSTTRGLCKHEVVETPVRSVALFSVFCASQHERPRYAMKCLSMCFGRTLSHIPPKFEAAINQSINQLSHTAPTCEPRGTRQTRTAPTVEL